MTEIKKVIGSSEVDVTPEDTYNKLFDIIVTYESISWSDMMPSDRVKAGLSQLFYETLEELEQFLPSEGGKEETR